MRTLSRHEPRQARTFLDVLGSTLAALRRLLGVNIPLTIVGVGLALTCLATMIGLLVDPRIITGVPNWLKPSKFAISFAIYVVCRIAGSRRGRVTRVS